MVEKQELKDTALAWGADFLGVADLAPFQNFVTAPPDLLSPYRRAVSIGASLAKDVVENLIDGPTPHYSHHYVTVNNLLDLIALRLTRHLEKQGCRALPIPASQTLDRGQWLGAISHKAVARMAGLGWQGKSLLLVNPQVGPRLRLVTVLTDADLPVDKILSNRCGKCEECVKACPAGAITGRPFGDGYNNRGEAWNAAACVDKLENDFARRLKIAPLICGLCIKACPFGRRTAAKP